MRVVTLMKHFCVTPGFNLAFGGTVDVIRRLIVCKRENRLECMIELC